MFPLYINFRELCRRTNSIVRRMRRPNPGIEPHTVASPRSTSPAAPWAMHSVSGEPKQRKVENGRATRKELKKAPRLRPTQKDPAALASGLEGPPSGRSCQSFSGLLSWYRATTRRRNKIIPRNGPWLPVRKEFSRALHGLFENRHASDAAHRDAPSISLAITRLSRST